MQPCFVSVWRAGALAPEPRRFELLDPTPIGRELLGVTDSTVSRAAKAPRLTSYGPAAAELHVPPNCANTVLVIHSSEFETLGRRLETDERWPIAPGGLNRRSALALGRRSSVALSRAANPQRPGPSDHLLALPRAERVLPGKELWLEAPALLVIGAGAVCVSPGETRLPDSVLDELPPPVSFRLPTTGFTFAGTRELDDFLNAPVPNNITVAGWDEPCTGNELTLRARELLSSLHTHFAFLPALVDDREPRLVLLYEREDKSVRALVSDGDIDEWVRDIDAALRAAERPRTERRTSAPPEAREDRAPEYDDRTLETETRPSDEPTEPATFGSIQTLDPAYAKVLAQVAPIAKQDLTVLLLGESGTGKEHLAKAIHAASPRAGGPFVAVNSSSLTDSLVESRLFGHKKGSFTGANTDHDGFFVSAEGGTLLLDEIGDAPAKVQTSLLRALEERVVRPLGSDRDRAVDVRVIAATRRDVHALMHEGKLGEDLYFRLAELTVTLPPLRERLVDLPLIAQSLLDAEACEKPLTKSALDRLCRHTWPGNIRELRNALRRAIAASGERRTLGPELFEHLDAASLRRHRFPPPFEFPELVEGIALEALDKGTLPLFPAKSQYEQRALQRAALLYLSETQPTLPPPFTVPWQRLFASRWHAAQGGRGLREVLRALGRPVTDRAAWDWVVRRSEGG